MDSAITNQMQNQIRNQIQTILCLKRHNYRETIFAEIRTFQEENFEQKIDFAYYVGKCSMCVSFESESLPSHRDVLKLVKVTEEHLS